MSYELDEAITLCSELAAQATDPTDLNHIVYVLETAKQKIEDLEYDLDAKDDEISSLKEDKEDLQEEVNDLEDELSARDD